MMGHHLFLVSQFNRYFLASSSCSRYAASLSSSSSTSSSPNNAGTGHRNEVAQQNQSSIKSNSSPASRGAAAGSLAHLRAYVLAMVGDYDPLYKLHVEQNCWETEVPRRWAEADSKTVNEVLIRLYNFEKRLLVGALAILYFAFLAFIAVAIFQMRRRGGEAMAKNLGDLKLWEAEFKTEKAIPLEEFLNTDFLNGKICKITYYSPPAGVLLVAMEDGDMKIINCQGWINNKK